MPASNGRAMAKSRGLPADVLIFDLEDAVAPDRKVAARHELCAALAAGGYGRRELVIRVNGLATPWARDDIAAAAGTAMAGAAAAGTAADAILLPKVDGPAAVQAAAEILYGAGAPKEMAIWCMLETPLGILRAEAVAAHPDVACLVAGTADLATDLHAQPTPDRAAFITSLGHCLLAARAHGRAALDGVFMDLRDDAGFHAECRQGRTLGFDGKSVIHPAQIDPANRVFGPSDDEVAEANRIIDAHAAATSAGHGVTVIDGRLIEVLHVANARRVVALAAAIGALADP